MSNIRAHIRNSVHTSGALPKDFEPDPSVKAELRHKMWYNTDDVVEWAARAVTTVLGKVAVKQDAISTFFALRDKPGNLFLKMIEEFPRKDEIEQADLSVLFERDAYWAGTISALVSALRDAGSGKSITETTENGQQEKFFLPNPSTARSIDTHINELIDKCLKVNQTQKKLSDQIDLYGYVLGQKILHPSTGSFRDIQDYVSNLGSDIDVVSNADDE